MYNRYLLHVAIYAVLSTAAGIAAQVALTRALTRDRFVLADFVEVGPPVVDVGDVDQLADDTPEGAA